MKIYFTASARGKKKYGENYRRIYEAIEELGYKNLDDLVLKIDPQKFYLGDQEDQVNLYRKAMDLVKSADIIVLEISIPSLSMGYVMDRALDEGKPVILLYIEGVNPYFAGGVQDEKLQVLPYTLETIKKTLEYAIKEAKNQMDSRFTLLLPPKIVNFLNKISKKRKIPKSVFIRNLIEEKMEKEK